MGLAIWALCRRRRRRRAAGTEEETIGRPYSRYVGKEVGGSFEPKVHPVSSMVRDRPLSPRLAPLDTSSPSAPLLGGQGVTPSPASTISIGQIGQSPRSAGVTGPVTPISASWQRTSTYRPATAGSGTGTGTFGSGAGAMSLASGSLVGEQGRIARMFEADPRMFESDDRDAKARLLDATGGESNFVALGRDGVPAKDDSPVPVSARPPQSAVEPADSPFADVPRPRPRARSLPTTNRPEIDPAPAVEAPPPYI